MMKKSLMSRMRILTGILIGAVVLISILGSIDMSGVTVLNHTIQIDAQPEAVWSVLADLEAVQHYNPAIQKASYLEGPRQGVGAARVCSAKEGVLRERVTGWEPLESIGMEMYESPWPIVAMSWTTRLAAVNGGTLVTQRLEYRMKYGVIGTLINSLFMRKMMNKGLDEVFASMKRYIEETKG